MRMRIAVVASVLGAACASGGGGSEGIVDFEAQLRPNAGFDVTGSSTAVASVGNTLVRVRIENATPGAIHPWHVHQGLCGSDGPIVGNASDYSPLEVDDDGTVDEVATIGVQLDDDADYYVNIHRSPQDIGTIVSCGRLVD